MLNSATEAGYRLQPTCSMQTAHPRKPSTALLRKTDLEKGHTQQRSLLYHHEFHTNTSEPLLIDSQKTPKKNQNG